MPALLSHYRPDAQIYAFTESAAVQRRLALYHGVTALRMPFGDDADETFDRCALGVLYWGKRLPRCKGLAKCECSRRQGLSALLQASRALLKGQACCSRTLSWQAWRAKGSSIDLAQ